MTGPVDNLAVIEAFSQAATQGDLEALADCMHPDFEIREAEGLPYCGVFRGLDGFLAMFRAMQQAWGDLGITHIATIGERDGEEFALHMRVDGIDASGAPVSSEVLERWVVRDGKVAAIVPFYWDTAALAARLGATRP